jgi:hypothetical protein
MPELVAAVAPPAEPAIAELARAIVALLAEAQLPEALTREQTAQFLNISLSHLDTMEKNGALGPLPLRLGSEKVLRYRREELLDWLRRGAPPRQRWQAIQACDIRARRA